MNDKRHNTVSIALVEADVAISVLGSAIDDRLTTSERKLLATAKEKLAVAESRVNGIRMLATQLGDGL